MPYLTIRTNQAVDDAAQQALLQQASAKVAQLLGKPESYVMVSIEAARPMLFAGSAEPLAYLELKSIGLPDSATTELSAGLCQLIGDTLSIEQSRIYIEFANAERHMWGWNGATF
jgi:phenylpyruvate tautomerase PptA (4-oxalocrotonate tautomerase family)